MKTNIGIEAIEYYLPDNVTKSKELSDLFGFDLEFIEQKIGVEKLYSSTKNSSTQLRLILPNIHGKISIGLYDNDNALSLQLRFYLHAGSRELRSTVFLGKDGRDADSRCHSTFGVIH